MRLPERLVQGAAALLAVVAVLAGVAATAGHSSHGRLAVLPFEINDTSGEVGGPQRHDAMLAGLTRVVDERIAAAGTFEVVERARVDAAVAAENSGTYLRSCNGCERDIARAVGADAVMIGWVHKVSSLVLSLHVVVKDVATGKLIYARVFDFRGDNEKSWKRAAAYMAEALARSIGKGSQPTN